MKKLFFAVALVAASFASPSYAKFEDGNRLHSDCASGPGTDYGVCLGYIIGVIDALEGSGADLCIRDGVKLRQVKEVTINYLRVHPELLVGNAIKQAFCS